MNKISNHTNNNKIYKNEKQKNDNLKIPNENNEMTRSSSNVIINSTPTHLRTDHRKKIEKISNDLNILTFWIDSQNCFETLCSLKRKLINIITIDPENQNYKITVHRLDKSMQFQKAPRQTSGQIKEILTGARSKKGQEQIKCGINLKQKNEFSEAEDIENELKNAKDSDYIDSIRMLLRAIQKIDSSGDHSLIKELMQANVESYIHSLEHNLWHKINENSAARLVEQMRLVENDVLLSEINKLLQELKSISVEKLEIESKLLLNETKKMNEKFQQLVEAKSEDLGTQLSEIQAELSNNVRRELISQTEKMKELNLEKQNLLDENRQHRLTEKTNDSFVDFMLKKFHKLQKHSIDQESDINQLKNKLTNMKMQFEKSTGCTHFVFKYYSKVATALANFKKTFTRKYHDQFLKDFQFWVETKFSEVANKGLQDQMKDHNFIINLTLPSFRIAINDWFSENVEEQLNLDIEAFQEGHSQGNETQVIEENNRLTKKLTDLLKFKDQSVLQQENDILRNQLNYYLESFQKKTTEQLEIKEVFTQHKNLGFYSQMLNRERESLLSQLDMYNHINKECFRKISELQKCVDSQKIATMSVEQLDVDRPNPDELKNVQSLLGSSRDLQTKTSDELFQTFDMIQVRFSEQNSHLYEILTDYSRNCNNVLNKNQGIDLEAIQKNYENTIIKLENYIQKIEGQYQDVLKKYSNAVYTISKFTRNEKDLMDNIKGVHVQNELRDQELAAAKQSLNEIQAKYDNMLTDHSDLQDKFNQLTNKFALYYKDNDITEKIKGDTPEVATVNISNLLSTNNRIYDLESKLQTVNKDIQDLKNENHKLRQSIDNNLEHLRKKDLRQNELHQKQTDLELEFDKSRQRIRRDTLDEQLNHMMAKQKQDDTHKTETLMIGDIRKDQEHQLNDLIHRLKIMSQKQTSMMDKGVHAKLRQVLLESKDWHVKAVALNSELKLLQKQNDFLQKQLDALHTQYSATLEEKRQVQVDTANDTVTHDELVEMLAHEKDNNTHLQRQFNYLLNEYYQLKDNYYEKGLLVSDLHQEMTDLVRELSELQEQSTIADYDANLVETIGEKDVVHKKKFNEWRTTTKSRLDSYSHEMRLLNKENLSLHAQLKESRQREAQVNSTLNDLTTSISVAPHQKWSYLLDTDRLSAHPDPLVSGIDDIQPSINQHISIVQPKITVSDKVGPLDIKYAKDHHTLATTKVHVQPIKHSDNDRLEPHSLPLIPIAVKPHNRHDLLKYTSMNLFNQMQSDHFERIQEIRSQEGAHHSTSCKPYEKAEEGLKSVQHTKRTLDEFNSSLVTNHRNLNLLSNRSKTPMNLYKELRSTNNSYSLGATYGLKTSQSRKRDQSIAEMKQKFAKNILKKTNCNQ